MACIAIANSDRFWPPKNDRPRNATLTIAGWFGIIPALLALVFAALGSEPACCVFGAISILGVFFAALLITLLNRSTYEWTIRHIWCPVKRAGSRLWDRYAKSGRFYLGLTAFFALTMAIILLITPSWIAFAVLYPIVIATVLLSSWAFARESTRAALSKKDDSDYEGPCQGDTSKESVHGNGEDARPQQKTKNRDSPGEIRGGGTHTLILSRSDASASRTDSPRRRHCTASIRCLTGWGS